MDPTKLRVKIFHHTRGHDEVRRFATGDPLREAIVFETVMFDGVQGVLRSVSTALRLAPRYGVLPKRGWAFEYRDRYRYRLEVGDVVVGGEAAYAVRELSERPDGYCLRNTQAVWEPVSLMGSKIVSDDAVLSKPRESRRELATGIDPAHQSKVWGTSTYLCGYHDPRKAGWDTPASR